jgi:hypothetical protein
MKRCPSCHRPCAERDLFCRHCGAALEMGRVFAWRRADWLDSRHALRAAAASAFVFAVRVLCHPLLMTFEGARHEGRVAAFHLCIGLACGLAAAPLRLDRSRWKFWAGLGLLGGALSWALDYSYMADHLVLTVVWQVLNWLDSSANSPANTISFGILQSLRYLGTVLVLGLAAGWSAPPAQRLKIALGSMAGLALRFGLLGFALAPGLLLLYPRQSLLYLSSLFVFFYGLGVVDENSVK